MTPINLGVIFALVYKYIWNLETNKLMRVHIDEALLLDKTDKFSISCHAKNKLIKEGVIDE